MATNTEIADVLETAADLYEAEQIEWCRKGWGVTHEDGTRTACASSALALASGLRQAHARMLENVVETGITADIGLSEPEELYLDVRKHVDEKLRWRLPAWNDHTVTRPRLNLDAIQILYVDGAYQVKSDSNVSIIAEAVPARTKEQVIELFKGLAKDLRNEE